MIRRLFFIISALILSANFLGALFYPPILWSLILFAPLILIGVYDCFQTQHTILRNFPVIGHFRYWLEKIRPEINQYFIESNSSGLPFSREDRSIVYQRAKGVLDTLPFGTQKDVYRSGYEWVNHSLSPVRLDPKTLKVAIGGPGCQQPYVSSLLNISGMSYGALSKNAVLALNQGAKMGGFAHNTGEGGVSPYHLAGGGDLTWQIGTGYFGCRTPAGEFCEKTFQKTANLPNIKMIEIKLSQGAKPGHGGILPAGKVTPEISAIRHVPMGKDVISPPAHSAFSTPAGLMEFIVKLRALSGGKPVGFKLCIGKRREFLALCKAMLKTGVTPDFITVDGGEGGTGAAPLEFSNYIGSPLSEALIFVHNALVGVDLRDRIKLIAGGKLSTGFGLIKRLCLGADLCNSARAMMMALGCVQALKCNTNTCPTGVTTQDPGLVSGLVVKDKTTRVYRYHLLTIQSAAEILGAMGLQHASELRPWHLMRRVSFTQIKHYGELYEYLRPGDLLKEVLPASYKRAWEAACSSTFAHASEVSDC